MTSENRIIKSIYIQWFLAVLFPRLKIWPVNQWAKRLSNARSVEFDRIEQACTLSAVIVVAYQIMPMSTIGIDALGKYLVQYVLLLPVLALLLGPFYIRRIRRGLEIESTESADIDRQ